MLHTGVQSYYHIAVFVLVFKYQEDTATGYASSICGGLTYTSFD